MKNLTVLYPRLRYEREDHQATFKFFTVRKALDMVLSGTRMPEKERLILIHTSLSVERKKLACRQLQSRFKRKAAEFN